MQKIACFHFDLKRPIWRRGYTDRMVVRLKAWGFNTILYELEDKLRLARQPTIAHAEAWSREQTRDSPPGTTPSAQGLQKKFPISF